jgi:hypothetical protein
VLDLGYLAGSIVVASCALLDQNVMDSRATEGGIGEGVGRIGKGEGEGEGEGGIEEGEGVTSKQQCFILLSEINALTLLWHEDASMLLSPYPSLSLSPSPCSKPTSTPLSLPSPSMGDRVHGAAHETLRDVYALCESVEREDAEDLGFSLSERKALCPERGILFFCDGSGRETLIRTMCESMLGCCRAVERTGSSRVCDTMTTSVSTSAEMASNSLKSAASSGSKSSMESKVLVPKQYATFAFKILLLAVLSLHMREEEKIARKKRDREEEMRFRSEKKISLVFDRKEVKEGGSDGGVGSATYSAHSHTISASSSGDVKVNSVGEILSNDMKEKKVRLGEGNSSGETIKEGEGEEQGQGQGKKIEVVLSTSPNPGPIPKKIPKRRLIQVVIVADDDDEEGGRDGDGDECDGAEGGGKPKKRKRKAVTYVPLTASLFSASLHSSSLLLSLLLDSTPHFFSLLHSSPLLSSPLLAIRHNR